MMLLQCCNQGVMFDRRPPRMKKFDLIQFDFNKAFIQIVTFEKRKIICRGRLAQKIFYNRSKKNLQYSECLSNLPSLLCTSNNQPFS